MLDEDGRLRAGERLLGAAQQVELGALDVDALRIVSEGVNRVAATGATGLLMSTHYTRILRYVKPDFVHVFAKGQIVESGGPELAEELEAHGYEKYTHKV